jgi:prevent-host-death family protein
MKTMAISEFKAHALRVLTEVAESREGIVITRRGKPLVQVVPHRESDTKPMPGKLAGSFTFEGDIVSPLGEAFWETCG